MTLDTLIMLSGACVALLPYLGLPNSWDSVLLVILGVCIIALGVVVRRQGPRGSRAHARASHIVEHMPESTDTMHDQA